MKKKIYTRPVSVMLSEEMFDQVKTIADNEEIGISDYIREAIREKLATHNHNQFQKEIIHD
jgi:metal-responsive CopG/Arc/MetJ family transcriptional regulator